MTGKYLNLVFQGGGVRGIAYAGVLATLPADCRIYSVGGTSAGALVAGLVALGQSADAIKGILEDKELYQLLDAKEVKRHERISEAWKGLLEIVKEGSNTNGVSKWKAFKFLIKHEGVLSKDLPEIWENRGLYDSRLIRTWLDKQFGTKTFSDILVKDLKIVVSDVSGRNFNIYDKENYPRKLISEAVHESISIPIFFYPFRIGEIHKVDGGILSNFPSFLFASENYPTVGFRLEDINRIKDISSTLSYLKSLLETMAEAHDKRRSPPQNFYSFPIEIPSRIPSTKFDLTEEDVRELYQKGHSKGMEVKWDEIARISPFVRFYDSRADEALELSISQANRVLESFYNSPEVWVDSLVQNITFTARIESDWSVIYDRVMEFEVKGSKPLFMVRSNLSSSIALSGRSLVDVYEGQEFTEYTDKGPKEVVHIPAYNSQERKGFLVIFTPPIVPGKPRRFYSGFKIPQEFKDSVKLGQEDELFYSIRQVGREHTANITFRILVDSDLPKLNVREGFQCEFEDKGTQFEETTKKTYFLWEGKINNQSIRAEVKYSFKVLLGINN